MSAFEQCIENSQLCMMHCNNLLHASPKVTSLRLIMTQNPYEPYYMKCGLTNLERRPGCMQPGIEADQMSLVFSMAKVPVEVYANALH